MFKSFIAKHITIIRVILARELRHSFQSSIEADIDTCLTFHATLGGNQNNTVSTLHTINGCSRGILQHGDGSH